MVNQNIIRLWSSNHEGMVSNKLKRNSAASKILFKTKPLCPVTKLLLISEGII